MTDHTIRIINAIKRSGKVWNQAVAEYMSEYSGCPIEEYTETKLNRILKEAFLDYLATCDNPSMEVCDLFDFMDNHGSESLGHHIADVLGMTQVRDGNEYVNGFREL
jgi:hypothetical protein